LCGCAGPRGSDNPYLLVRSLRDGGREDASTRTVPAALSSHEVSDWLTNALAELALGTIGQLNWCVIDV